MSRGEAAARKKRRAKLSLPSYLSVSVSPFVPGFSLFLAQPLSFYLIFFLLMNQNNTSFLSLTRLNRHTNSNTTSIFPHDDVSIFGKPAGLMERALLNLKDWGNGVGWIVPVLDMQQGAVLQQTAKLNWRLNTGFECQTNDSRIASLCLKFLTGLASDCDF